MSQTVPCSCRLPQEEADAVDAVAEEQSRMRAEVIRRAVRWYLSSNPDEVRVLSGSNQ